jgi:prepilin-type N-terminal cleavage/methylation domain-containing protein
MAKQNGGFTLIELMVTIALLVFLGAMAGRSLFDVNSWLANSRLKAAARELSLNLENRSWKVVFDTGNNSYSLQFDKGASWESSSDPVVNLASQYQSGIEFGRGVADGVDEAGGDVTFTGTPPEVVFSFTGAANETGYCYLSNNQDASYAVGVMATGNVVVKKWNTQANKWQ